MKKISVSLCTACLVFILFFVQGETVQAKDWGWILDTNELQEVLSSYIHFMSIIPNKDQFDLYINEYYCGKFADPIQYEWQSDDQTRIDISVNLQEKKASFLLKQTQMEVLNSLFIFEISKTGEQIATLYPNLQNQDVKITKKGKLSNGVYQFGTFQFTYSNESFSYNVWIDDVKEIAYIQKDGQTGVVAYPLKKSDAVRKLYFENLVPAQALRMDYMEKSMEKVSFDKASQFDPLYSNTEVDAAVRNESIALINATTKKTYNVNLSRLITFWERVSGTDVGTGEYGSTTSTIQVVCQWGEDACNSVRNRYQDTGRLYAVYGKSIQYPIVEKVEDERKVQVITTEYRNAYWTDDWTQIDVFQNIPREEYTLMQYKEKVASLTDWSAYSHTSLEKDECEDDASCNWQGKIMYKKNVGTWSVWSDYDSSVYPSDCEESSNCEWRKKTLYSRKIGTWSDWSKTEYSANSDDYINCKDSMNCDWKVSSTISQYRKRTAAATYGSCSDSNCENWVRSGNSNSSNPYRNAYQYTCKWGVLSNTKYSLTNYSIGTKGPCNGSYTVSDVVAGKQKGQWGNWGSWSSDIRGTIPSNTYTTTLKTGYKDTSEHLYKIRNLNWGTWSKYTYSTCSENETTKCRKEVFYSTKKRTWSGWSSYQYDSCTASSDVKCESAMRYRFQYAVWQPWSNWKTTEGQQSSSLTRLITYRYKNPTYRWEKKKGTSTSIGEDGFYTQKTRVQNTVDLVRDEWAEEVGQVVGNKGAMTRAMIEKVTDSIKEAMKETAALTQLKRDMNTEDIRYADVVSKVQEESGQNEGIAMQRAKQLFEKQPIFIPYLYITEHWRAVEHDTDIAGYEQRITYDTNVDEAITIHDTASLFYSATNQPSRVVYYDYHDPLRQFEGDIPDNWKGYEALVEVIQNTDLNLYKIRVNLSKDDLRSMKEYLKHNASVLPCEFVKQYRHVFQMSDSMWNQLMEGCVLP